MYYVYVLHNSVTKMYYTGYSSDLKRRFQEHVDGNNMSTKSHHEFWKLVYYEAYLSEKSARSRELQLKSH
jgi:putative endonuclease